MLRQALSCIQRGWHVFPCIPRDKWPRIAKKDGGHGYKDATLDEAQIRAWWTQWPDCNPGIATGKSGIVVCDVDNGITEDTLTRWCEDHGIPATYAVRTGSRPKFKVQLYFSNPQGHTVPSFNHWEDGEQSGDVRGTTWGHVLAAGSVHPSGAAYEVLWDLPLAPVPDFVRGLKLCPPKDKEGKPLPPRTLADTGPISEWRNDAMTRLLGQARAQGQDDDQIAETAHRLNDERMVLPLEEDELENIIQHACEWEIGEPDPVVLIGGKPVNCAGLAPVDWRTHYHSFAEMESAPPITFLIDGFLPHESIAALAAPVGQRKSLIALNVAHALCTGEPLFDHFKVLKRPERVLYLCPEMGIRSFTDRLRKIGLLPEVGKSLFCRTMSAGTTLELDDLTPEELGGAVVIIDTAIRYLKGDENSSEHMRVFAASVFRLMHAGAASVLLLHHSAKGTKESNDLTLENAMRGSGELGAFLTTCWATRLQDPSEPYKSASFLTNVKQRDFESRPFEVTSGPDCRLHFVETDGPVTLKNHQGNKANKDGMDAAAEALIRANLSMSVRKLEKELAGHGIKRGTTWISKARARLQIEAGVPVLAGP